MANAAFFVGLMVALPNEYGEIAKRLSFDDAKENFFAAARHGLHAQLRWLDGKSMSASFLILNELLPLARAGLKQSKVDSNDIDKYLGVLEERVRRGKLSAMDVDSLGVPQGSQWHEPMISHGTLIRYFARRRRAPGARMEMAERGELDDWP